MDNKATSSSRPIKKPTTFRSQSQWQRKASGGGRKKQSSSSSPPRNRHRYARRPITFEYSKSRTVHVVVCALIATQAVIGACLLIGGSVALFYCAEVSFAGYTPITGGLYLIASVAMGYYTYSEDRLYCLLASILSFFIAILLSVSEFLGVHCLNSLTPEKSPCGGFLIKANLCVWVMDVSSGVWRDIPDSFSGGRVATVFLSIMAVILSIATSISFIISDQAGGDAVYLYHKRSKTFYVVGDLSNVALAFDNEEKNGELTAATAKETRLYDVKRSSFSVTKKTLLPSSMISSQKSIKSDSYSSKAER
uniref:Uncharacterized protein n=1 Tax=Romanomermis culicivorax TaxID=13658 RepID=A0A915JLZ2_ROMCU